MSAVKIGPYPEKYTKKYAVFTENLKNVHFPSGHGINFFLFLGFRHNLGSILKV